MSDHVHRVISGLHQQIAGLREQGEADAIRIREALEWRDKAEDQLQMVSEVATEMAATMRDVLSIVDALPDYPWHGGALKQQMREDITAYELLGLDTEDDDA